MNNQIYVNPVTDAAIISLLSNMFNHIAYLDPLTVRNNIELGCEGGMSKEDRSIDVELGDFIVKHFSVFYLGLTINEEFRESVKEAVCVEIGLEEKSNDFVDDFRKDVMLHCKGKVTKRPKGSYVLNFTAYDDDTFRNLYKALFDSFLRTSEYNDLLDTMARDLSEDDLLDIGFIISNFMYLFRAFSKNTLFADYVQCVLLSVEKELDIIIT
jgi:hypothetical protein